MAWFLRFARVLSLVLVSVLGASVLMYAAPGYFSDAGEMDAAHAATTRGELQQLAAEQHSLRALLSSEIQRWSHGDLGQSRQFGVSVASLVSQRSARSAKLLVAAVALGWSLASLIALPLSLRGGALAGTATALTTALLLALPVGLLATICLLSNVGGPVLVLATVIAARDLKMLHRIFQSAWRAPHVFHAYASGIAPSQVIRSHLLPNVGRELGSVAIMSFTLALSALVPVEVIFDVPGLGQLAWSAAMNRDLPVLIAVTALMSACVGVAGSFLRESSLEQAPCA